MFTSETESPVRPDGFALARGVLRLLAHHGMAGLTEMTLANGRRTDVFALTRTGEIWIVEVKSSVADFRSDGKWQDYLDYCDRFLFAVPADFPLDLIPADCGLMVVDPFDGAIVRDAPVQKLAAARRKALTLAFGRLGAERLRLLQDPGGIT